jgi:hypothetical protein
MEVLIFTLLISMLLAVLFIVLFLRDCQNRQSSSLDQEALLPLQDDEGCVGSDKKGDH